MMCMLYQRAVPPWTNCSAVHYHLAAQKPKGQRLTVAPVVIICCMPRSCFMKAAVAACLESAYVSLEPGASEFSNRQLLAMCTQHCRHRHCRLLLTCHEVVHETAWQQMTPPLPFVAGVAFVAHLHLEWAQNLACCSAVESRTHACKCRSVLVLAACAMDLCVRFSPRMLVLLAPVCTGAHSLCCGNWQVPAPALRRGCSSRHEPQVHVFLRSN